MADPSKLKLAKTPAASLGTPPKPAEVIGNVQPKPKQLGDYGREMRAEKAAAAQAESEPVKHKGRPPLDYQTRQLGARVHVDTFARVQAIARRERVGLGPLVDRMVREWERMRVGQAEAMGPRQDGEDDDAYIARVFRL